MAGFASASAKRTVVATAFALIVLVAMPAVGTARQGSGARAKRGCAALTLEFFPKRVHAGDGVDLDFSLTNCSSRTERLVVVVSSKGPCPLIPPSEQTFRLGPDEGVGSSGLFIAPDCPGRYRLKAAVLRKGERLDRAVTGLTVSHAGLAPA
jgi:hypothetical protein